MKIVLLDAYTLGRDLDYQLFNSFGDVEVFDFSTNEEVILRGSTAQVLISNKIQYTRELLLKLPNLRLICLTSTGTNTVDLEAARELSIDVRNIRGYSTESVVQMTFSMLFYLLAPLRYYDDYVKNGTYVNDFSFSHYQETWSELSGKTMGIVGLGTIGKKVATIGKAFGARVIFFSASGDNTSEEFQRVDFEALIKEADIISIHAPLSEKTNNMFHYEVFRQMKPTAILLNLGRGPIVNESELIDALNNNLIAKAGLDVLKAEPMKDQHDFLRLRDSRKLLITPHIAWASVESRNRMLEEVSANIKDFIAGGNRNKLQVL